MNRIITGMYRDKDILDEVLIERDNQNKKWGRQDHSTVKWLAILMEEVGEASKEVLEENPKLYREELIQVAAVAVAAIENFDRRREELQ